MITIIHGSHRHGYCWQIVNELIKRLKPSCDQIEVIDLSESNIEFCCGSQACQDGTCIYEQDDFAKLYKNLLINTAGIYVVTPTYFNMPPAKLKNFIDRTNALLPFFDSAEHHPFFGAFVCGEADAESNNSNLSLLCEYADIMGWKKLDQLNHIEIISDAPSIPSEAIIKIADAICEELRIRKE